MKTIQNILVLMILVALLANCIPSKKRNADTENQEGNQQENPETQTSDSLQSQSLIRCSTMEVLEKHMARTPDLRSKMETIETLCQRVIQRNKKNKVSGTDTISIPTIVHVIYSNDVENISDEQISSQIDVLNQDFTKTNEDSSQIPEEFMGIAAETNIHFSLDSILRIPATRDSWGTDDQMKFASNGGSNVISPETHLNIWVCTIGGGILGYAQFPGDSADTDGIVVSSQFFGTKGSVTPPFNKGRTTTHEVGHWLNLRHIWGDGNCSQDDFVEDTPRSDGPNYGCPEYPIVRCESNDITMNFMDYTDDACMYMFTEGQKERMRSVFAIDGPRESFIK
ncbi:zinc metalloprotease [Aquimarina pacifica]|uniref:zinc metalloprotease n=1 Tax=Aquimarina pacifica TaxID=1296415 RepID=UPI0004706849|nr:zinc metalloprotease [Aquimarina pacifica]